MRRRRLLVPFAILGNVARAHAADAELPLDLSWEAPPECASAAQIRAELGRIARVRPGRSLTRLAAVGQIVATGGSYHLTLRTERDGVTGERSLASGECRSLEREVTLVLAVAFGEGVDIVEPEAPPAATSAPGPAPAAAAAAAAASGGARTAAPAREPSPEASRPRDVAPVDADRREKRGSGFHAAPFVGAGVLSGVLPSVTPLGVLGAEIGMRHFWLEPRVVWLPGTDDTLPRGVVATYDGLGGTVSACASLPPYALSIDACLGVDVWALRGRSTGASESGSAVAPFIAGVAALGWQWPPRGGIRFGLDAEVHVAFGEPRFIVEGLGDVHRVARASPALAVKILLVPGG